VFADLVRLGDEPVLTEERARSRNRLIDFIASLFDCPHLGFYLSGTALRDDGDHGHQLSSERTASASEIVKDQLLDLLRARDWAIENHGMVTMEKASLQKGM
jgi:hypothetical protein